MRRTTLLLSLILFSVSVSNAQKSFQQQLADSALVLTKQSVRYDPAYFSIAYPMVMYLRIEAFALMW